MSRGFPIGEARVVKETDRALIVMTGELGFDLAVPRNAIHEASQVRDIIHGEGNLVVEEWWAKKKGWI